MFSRLPLVLIFFLRRQQQLVEHLRYNAAEERRLRQPHTISTKRRAARAT